MWAIFKIDQRKIDFFKRDLIKKIGNDFVIYYPKLQIKKTSGKLLINKEHRLMGNYLFFYHKNLNDKNFVYNLKFIKGLKHILEGFYNSQKNIELFIQKCKDSESKEGFIKPYFFNLNKESEYQFTSGPLINFIFKIAEIEKNKLKIFLGNVKTSFKKDELLFRPV